MASNRWFNFEYGAIKPVFEEALEHKCKVAVVKNHGLALISQKGEVDKNQERTTIAYAKGFNPAEDDDWYDKLGNSLGYDDFVIPLDLFEKELTEILNFKSDIRIKFTSSQTIVEVM